MKEEFSRGSSRHTQSDQVQTLAWALVLIWAGCVFIAKNIGLLASVTLPGRGVTHLGAWTLIFLGAGLIMLFAAGLRLLWPAARSESATGSLIFAAVLIGIGLNNLYDAAVIWPLILIAIGVSVFLGGIFQRR